MPKKCKVCPELFLPVRPLQVVCGYQCAAIKAEQDRKKTDRKELRVAKVKAKTRRDWMKEAQVAVNRYIRARDTKAGLPCVSCGRFHQGQNHAGHYRATSIAPAIRFHPDNIWLQCSPCNLHKHGSPIEYRIELIKRIGVERVEWLEGPHESKQWKIEELKAIKEMYRVKIKLLEV